MIHIANTSSGFEREPLASPFGFKGSYLSELWQTAALICSDRGSRGLGLGTQSTLWSDPAVFASNTESTGNQMMYDMTAHALQRAKDLTFETPHDLLDQLLPLTHEYGKRITGRDDLRLTFALNALVAVDNAAWQLYAAENGITSFDEMIPTDFRPALPARHTKLAGIPLMTYGVPVEEIIRTVEEGYFLLKIKLGSDPDGDGGREKMLAWDQSRLEAIHKAVKDVNTPHGPVLYYLDANGRYDSKDRLMRLLDHAEKIGALDRIILLEEPFPESHKTDVTDIPVRLAADESAHCDQDARERIALGYRAIALKPIAKTMSMSLRIARAAHDLDVPCFCADLTVNPILVDWNKNVAARLAPLPGMEIGVLESNGHQNYRNWEAMKTYHPSGKASWINNDHGIFHLDEAFYATSGGIFDISSHYLSLATSTC